jgi:O-antigen/teichoic acid export membrane protein
VTAIAAPRQVVANMFAKGTAFLVEKGAQLALIFVVGHELGEAGFGRFSYAVNLAVLLAFVTDLGLTTWTTRALAREPELAPAVLGTGLRLRLLAAIPVAIALGSVSLTVGDRGYATAVLALGAAYLARGFCDHGRAVFRAHERLGDEGRVNVAIALLGTAGGVTGLLVGAGGLAALALGILAGTLAGACYGFVLLGRNYGAWAGPADWTLARRMLREGAPFWLAGGFTLVYARADVLLLEPLSSYAEVGAYRAARQLIEVAQQLPFLLMTATFPQLARAFQESRQSLARVERQIAMLLLVGGLVVGGGLALAAEPIVTLGFGAGFGRTVPALRALALAVPPIFVNCGLLYFFVARDRGTLNMALAAVAALINVGANFVLDRRLGALGAATSTVITEAVLLACCLYALRVVRREDVS